MATATLSFRRESSAFHGEVDGEVCAINISRSNIKKSLGGPLLACFNTYLFLPVFAGIYPIDSMSSSSSWRLRLLP